MQLLRRLPYFPITAGLLGMIPRSSKRHIEFGPPIPTCGFGGGAAEDPKLVFELDDHLAQLPVVCTC